jgi:elongator complex protein 1
LKVPLPPSLAYCVELDIPTDDLNDERTRPIERGSRIITIMPSVHAVVLQAPRGNLETISPRALVLASVRQSIGKKEFRAAFLTCRSHRIDMNILHNHQPELFMTNIPLFIQQLRDVEYIDLFLSSLKYPPVMPQAECRQSSPTNLEGSKATSVSKVSIICDAILSELLTQYPTTHTQSILTAHLSKIPPDIPAALRVIAQLKGIVHKSHDNNRRQFISRSFCY